MYRWRGYTVPFAVPDVAHRSLIAGLSLLGQRFQAEFSKLWLFAIVLLELSRSARFWPLLEGEVLNLLS